MQVTPSYMVRLISEKLDIVAAVEVIKVKVRREGERTQKVKGREGEERRKGF